MSNSKCSNCKYWEGASTEGPGTCMRFPPQSCGVVPVQNRLTQAQGFQPIFSRPITGPEESCGEFTPKYIEIGGTS